jgi:hypothetical protein
MIRTKGNALHQQHNQYIIQKDFAICTYVEPFDLIDYRYDLSGYDLFSCPNVRNSESSPLSQMEKPIKSNDCRVNRNRRPLMSVGELPSSSETCERGKNESEEDLRRL